MEKELIKTCIIESNSFFREGLKSILRDSRFRIDCEAESVADALTYMQNEHPDLVIAELPVGAETVPADFNAIREAVPDARIVALVGQQCPMLMTDCLMQDIDGFLIKTMKPSVLLQSLALIAEGERVYPANLVGTPAAWRCPVHGGHAGQSGAVQPDGARDGHPSPACGW